MLFTLENDTVHIPRVIGYDVGMEGTTVLFRCPLGLSLIGSNSAICTHNGEWEPDPKGTMCNNMSSEGRLTMMHKLLPTLALHSLTFPYHTESAIRLIHVSLGCKRKSVSYTVGILLYG